MPSELPRAVDLLANATLADGTTADVRIDGGRIVAVTAAGTQTAEPGRTLDLTGHVLLPAAAEPHAHLDKALTWDRLQPPAGDLERAVRSFHDHADGMTADDIAGRATAVLRRMLANGVTAVRTHVNFYPGRDRLRGFEALAEVRRAFRGLVDVEIVALPGWDVPDALIEAALDAGADLVGGAPHLAPDPESDTRRLLDLAERRGVGVDLHADESLGGPLTLSIMAERLRHRDVPKTAGHCVRLGTLDPADLAPVVERVREAGIGVVTLPITNLYLQGWDQPVATPRGLTAIRALLDAGVVVGAGADNVRDPFNPLGRCDPLETAMLLVVAGHLSIAEAVALTTDGARAVLHLAQAGPRNGAQADLLAVRGTSLGDVVATAPADRIVLHRGRVVAETRTLSSVAETAPALTR